MSGPFLLRARRHRLCAEAALLCFDESSFPPSPITVSQTGTVSFILRRPPLKIKRGIRYLICPRQRANPCPSCPCCFRIVLIACWNILRFTETNGLNPRAKHMLYKGWSRWKYCSEKLRDLCRLLYNSPVLSLPPPLKKFYIAVAFSALFEGAEGAIKKVGRNIGLKFLTILSPIQLALHGNKAEVEEQCCMHKSEQTCSWKPLPFISVSTPPMSLGAWAYKRHCNLIPPFSPLSFHGTLLPLPWPPPSVRKHSARWPWLAPLLPCLQKCERALSSNILFLLSYFSRLLIWEDTHTFTHEMAHLSQNIPLFPFSPWRANWGC